MEVVGQGRILDEAAEHQQEAAAEAGHQLALGGRLARLDPPDEIGGVRRRGSFPRHGVALHPDREDERSQDQNGVEPAG